MTTVTTARPAANESAESRNGAHHRRSEAVTATRPVQNNAGPRPVTCRKCGAEISSDKGMLVFSRANWGQGLHSGDPICIPCANEDRYLLPWLGSPRPRSEYEHRCWRCGRFFYGSIHRRYCSEECGELERRSRRDRTGDRATHRCACGQAFTARADARYCSGACRQRAYRQRGGAS
jgi:hypothetical protein